MNAEEHKVGMDSAEGWQWDQEIMVLQAEIRSRTHQKADNQQLSF